jgi:hypothetical protein
LPVTLKRIAGQLLRKAGQLCTSCCGATARQARRCSDDALADVWMTPDDAATLTGAFELNNHCFYFDFDDPLGAPGTIYTPGDVTEFDDCDICNDPCRVDASPATPCDNYRLTYHRKVETFATDNSDCSGSPASTVESDQDKTLGLPPPGIGGGNVWVNPPAFGWSRVDSLGEVALGFHCPEGWVVGFSDPDNLDNCYSTRATGLVPDDGDCPNFPDVTCCESIEGPPGVFTTQRVTYSNICLRCNDEDGGI